MDPEQLLESINAALSRGATQAEIEERLSRVSQFSTIRAVRDAAANAAAPAPVRESSGAPADAGNVADAFAVGAGRGATADFLDEIAGTVGAAGPLTREEAIARVRERNERLAQEHPIASTLGLLTGAIAVPGAGLARLAGLGRGGAGIGRLGRLAPQSVRGKAAVGAGQLGALGGAEAGLFAAGGAEGGLDERLAAAQDAAPVGAALGVVTGGALGAASGARAVREAAGESLPIVSGGAFGSAETAARARQRATQTGQDLIERVRSRGSLAGDPGPVRARAAQLRERARDTFKALEDQGQNIPAELTQEALDNPTIRRELGKLRSEGAARVRRSFDKFKAGEAKSVVPLSFRQADDIAKNLRERASFFAQNAAESGGIKSGTPGRVDLTREAEEAFDVVDTVMRESLEGFAEAKDLWSQQAQELRALFEGRKLWNAAATDVAAAAANIADPLAQRAFREGLATELVQTVGSGSASVRSLIQNALTSPETQQKLRIIMGEGAEGFLDDLAATGRLISKARLIELVGKGLGFAFGGTSIAGGAAATIF